MIFLGIQSKIVGYYYPMTKAVKGAVETVYENLAERDEVWGIVKKRSPVWRYFFSKEIVNQGI